MDSISAEWHAAPLERISSRARALCAHAEQLTRSPASVTDHTIAELRAAGCDDEAIHDLTQVVSLFNYYNRLVDGLGADPEPEWGH